MAALPSSWRELTQVADAMGPHQFRLDTSAIPTSVGVITATSGSNLAFQVWHRDVDANGAVTSNTSAAIGVTLAWAIRGLDVEALGKSAGMAPVDVALLTALRDELAARLVRILRVD